MKRIVNILKMILYFVLGYLLFTFIISLVEFVLLSILRDGANNFVKLFFNSFNGNLLGVYTITYLMIFILNVLYNFVSIKRLNAKLNKVKKG